MKVIPFPGAPGAATPERARGEERASSTARPVVADGFFLDLLSAAESSIDPVAITFTTPDGHHVGDVVLGNGQVGSVLLASEKRHLFERLVAQQSEAAYALVAAVRRARAERRPLQSALTQLPEEQRDALRAALFEHFVDGLTLLGQIARAGLVQQVTAVTRRLAPSTLGGFSPTAVYWSAAPRVHPPVDDVCARAFEEHDERLTAILCVRATADSAIPVRARGLSGVGLALVRRLAAGIPCVVAPPSLRADALAPQILLLGGESSTLYVITPAQVALFPDLPSSARSRTLSRVAQLVERSA